VPAARPAGSVLLSYFTLRDLPTLLAAARRLSVGPTLRRRQGLRLPQLPLRQRVAAARARRASRASC